MEIVSHLGWRERREERWGRGHKEGRRKVIESPSESWGHSGPHKSLDLCRGISAAIGIVQGREAEVDIPWLLPSSPVPSPTSASDGQDPGRAG